MRAWPTTLPRGCLAAALYSWMVQSPACWNTVSGPPGPVDSRLMKAPTRAAHLLLLVKPCAACSARFRALGPKVRCGSALARVIQTCHMPIKCLPTGEAVWDILAVADKKRFRVSVS